MTSNTPSAPTVCVVDDDEAVRDSLQVLLTTRGFAVRTYESAKPFLGDSARGSCQCLLLDMHMPEMMGLTLLMTLRAQGDFAPTIVVTGAGDETLAELVMREGALGLLKKPVDEGELIEWVNRAIAEAGRIGYGAH